MHSQPHMSIDKLIKDKNYPIYLGPQAWIHVLLKIKILIEKKCANQSKHGCIFFKKKIFYPKGSK